MNQVYWAGALQGLGEPRIEYIIDKIKAAIRQA